MNASLQQGLIIANTLLVRQTFFFGRSPRVNRYVPWKPSPHFWEDQTKMNCEKVTLQVYWFLLNEAGQESRPWNTAMKISLPHLAAVGNPGRQLKWANAGTQADTCSHLSTAVWACGARYAVTLRLNATCITYQESSECILQTTSGNCHKQSWVSFVRSPH